MKISFKLIIPRISAYYEKFFHRSAPKLSPKRIAGFIVVITSLAMVVVTISISIFYKEKPAGTVVADAPANAQVVDSSSTDTVKNTVSDQAGVAFGVGGCVGGKNCPKITFSADPGTVPVGTESNLAWTSTGNPTSCEASGDWTGTKQFAGTESTGQLKEARPYTYTIKCKNADGEGFSTLTVSTTQTVSGGTGNVADRPDVTLAATPTTVVQGTSTNLSWSTAGNPTSCIASGSWSGSKQTTDSSEDSPKISNLGTASFSLKCSNSAGFKIVTISVTVIAPPAQIPIISISNSAGGSVIYAAGLTVTISYSATNNPNSCVASGDWSNASGKALATTPYIFSVPSPGSTPKTFKFNLNCSTTSGGQGSSETDLIVNPAKPVVSSLTFSPNIITSGGVSVLSWSVANSPTNCVQTSPNNDWPTVTVFSGSGASITTAQLTAGANNTPISYSYTLYCANSGGTSSTVTAKLYVNPANVTIPSFAPSSGTVGSGGTVNINWSVNNIQSGTYSSACSGTDTVPTTNPNTDNFKTITAPSTGTASVKMPTVATSTNYTFTLNCWNFGYNASGTVVALTHVQSGPITVTVTNGALPPTIGTFTVSAAKTNAVTGTAGASANIGIKQVSGTSIDTVQYNVASISAGKDTSGNTATGLSCVGAATTSATNATTSVITVTGWTGTSLTNGGTATIPDTDISNSARTIYLWVVCTNANAAGSNNSQKSVTIIINTATVASTSTNPVTPITLTSTKTSGGSVSASWSSTPIAVSCTSVINSGNSNSNNIYPASMNGSGSTTWTYPANLTTANVSYTANYTVTCTDAYNNTGNSTLTAAITVSPYKPCGGAPTAQCYGPSNIGTNGTHNTSCAKASCTTPQCWAWSGNNTSNVSPYSNTYSSKYPTIWSLDALLFIVTVTGGSPTTHKGNSSINTSGNNSDCGKDITSSMNSNHSHSNSDYQKYSQSFIGYYDASN